MSHRAFAQFSRRKTLIDEEHWNLAPKDDRYHCGNAGPDRSGSFIVGYTFEWESVEYTQDMIAAGGSKGLILLGESKSLQGGMKYCAEWLKTFISEVPIEYVPVAEPYWNPQNPVLELNPKSR